MELKKAFEIVINLAEQNIIDEDDARVCGQQKQRKEQIEALDLIENHFEKIFGLDKPEE